MGTINKAKYLSLLVLLGAWGCANQNVSRSGGGYDDLYGGGSVDSRTVTRDRGADQEFARTDNPDYSYTGDYAESGTSDYYDESYLSSRGVKRAVSNDVGYNAGFVDGINQASALSNRYYGGGLGSYWPGAMNMGLSFGFRNSFRMRPYLGYGFGSSFGFSPWGYSSPFGYGSMMAYDPFMDPFGYGSMYGYGYSPYGSMYGYSPYDSMYGYGGGYGGYYSPWAYSRPVVVVNGSDRGRPRTYGPRISANRPSSRGEYAG